MRQHQFGALTWDEATRLPPDTIALLPVGAVEAHGPHLPLDTDVIIAEAVADAAAARLDADGHAVVVLPTIAYAPAPFAVEFPGTISTDPDHLTGQIVAIARALARHPVGRLVLVNAHFDPANVTALREAVAVCAADDTVPVIFPDVTRRHLAVQLGDEFASGACHAGRYEGSIVLAVRPDLVREDTMRALAPNPVSLSVAIRDGKSTFHEAGGPNAYFGAPADATAAEGTALLETLSHLIADAALAGAEAA